MEELLSVSLLFTTHSFAEAFTFETKPKFVISIQFLSDKENTELYFDLTETKQIQKHEKEICFSKLFNLCLTKYSSTDLVIFRVHDMDKFNFYRCEKDSVKEKMQISLLGKTDLISIEKLRLLFRSNQQGSLTLKLNSTQLLSDFSSETVFESLSLQGLVYKSSKTQLQNLISNSSTLTHFKVNINRKSYVLTEELFETSLSNDIPVQ